MRTLLLPFLLTCVAATGCATGAGGARSDGARADDSDPTDGRRAKERALLLARKRLEQVQLANLAAEKALQNGVAAAEEELRAAQAELATFRDVAAPLALEKAKLELAERRNGLQETVEELEQLKLMYAEQDLADKTREMVLARTERRLAQAQAELTLAERELALLVEHEQPEELRGLAAAAAQKERALEETRREARVEWNAKQIELLEAQHAVADAEEELAAEGEGGDGE